MTIVNVSRCIGCSIWRSLLAKVEERRNLQSFGALCQRLSTVPPNVGGLTPYETQQMHATNKKTVKVAKITVILPNDSKTVLSLEAAQKIAKRRNYKLIKVKDADNATERATYQLLGTSSLTEISNEKKLSNDTTGKKVKVLSISGRISESDLKTKIKQIKSLLANQRMVRVILHTFGESSQINLKDIEQEVAGLGTMETEEEDAKRNSVLFTPTQKSSTETTDTMVDEQKIEQDKA